MERFWDDALTVWEAAQNAPDESAPEMAVILDERGALRMVMEPGWSAEGLRAEYGGAIYHVTRTPQGIRLEGRGRGMSCSLRAEGYRAPRESSIALRV
jgi:hypothetical protein